MFFRLKMAAAIEHKSMKELILNLVKDTLDSLRIMVCYQKVNYAELFHGWLRRFQGDSPGIKTPIALLSATLSGHTGHGKGIMFFASRTAWHICPDSD